MDIIDYNSDSSSSMDDEDKEQKHVLKNSLEKDWAGSDPINNMVVIVNSGICHQKRTGVYHESDPNSFDKYYRSYRASAADFRARNSFEIQKNSQSGEKPNSSSKMDEVKMDEYVSDYEVTRASEEYASKNGAGDAAKRAKTEIESKKDQVSSVNDKSPGKKQSSKTSEKVSAKDEGGKSTKKTNAEPTNEEIHAEVTTILKQVDFTTATLSDILGELGTHFGVNLMHRKTEVEAIITAVINNMSDGESDRGSKMRKSADN